MAPKKLVFGKNGEQEDKQQTPADEESYSYSDSEEEEKEEGTVPPPEKPKSVIPRELAGPEPGEIGSACSSPSASGFIIMPAVKPGGGKKTTTTTTKTSASNKKFRDEDVIALLKGLAAFWANGRNNKWTEFHQFVKDDLANQFSKIQVSEKIRALKRKFETNSERARANGGRLDFPDSHESIVFELSKGLWGDEEGMDQETGERAENVIEEANKKPREREQMDDEVNKTTRKREEVDDEVDEGSKKSRKQKQVEEHDDRNKKRRKRKRVDEHDQRNRISEQEKLEDEHDEESKISKQGKLEDEHDEKSKISKQGNREDEHYEEDNIPQKGKTVMEMSKEDFKSAYPLLYASFDMFGYPKIAKEICVLIAQEKAQELEQKWRELSAEARRLELKRIDLIKRDLEDHLQRK